MGSSEDAIKEVNELIGKYAYVFLEILEETQYSFFVKQIKPDERFLYISPNIQNITGYNDQDHYSNPDIMKSRLLPSFKDKYQNIHKSSTDAPISKIIKFRDRDNNIIDAKYYLTKLETDDNRLFVMGIFKDIAEERSFEKIVEQNIGHLTMCSYCSDVNDSNSWVRVEDVLQQIFNKKFTHGICDSCRYVLTHSEFDNNSIDAGDFELKTEKIKHFTTRSKKNLAESRYNVIFENSPTGIVGQLDGKIVLANPSFATMLGYDTVDQVVGLELKDIISPEEVNEIRERGLRRQAGKDEPEEFYTAFVTKDSDNFQAYVKVAYLEFSRLGEVPIMYVIKRDTDD